MKLSAYTDVCLRVLMTLAAAEGERLTSQQIADRIQVPYNHVIKAVAELRRRGAIDVARGRLGGATIAEAGLQPAELVSGIHLRDGFGARRQHRSGQQADTVRCAQPLRIQAEIARQCLVEHDQGGLRRGLRLPADGQFG